MDNMENMKIACAAYIATILIGSGKVPQPKTDEESQVFLNVCERAFEHFLKERGFSKLFKPIPTINAILPTGTN